MLKIISGFAFLLLLAGNVSRLFENFTTFCGKRGKFCLIR